MQTTQINTCRALRRPEPLVPDSLQTESNFAADYTREFGEDLCFQQCWFPKVQMPAWEPQIFDEV